MWVDTFAEEGYKTIMLSLLLLAPPRGVVIGYVTTAVFISNLTWQWTFYLQAGIALIPAGIVMFGIKNKYFDIEEAVERRYEESSDIRDIQI